MLAVRNANSFVMALASDLHTNGSDNSSTSVLHAGQGMDAINSMTQLDLVALLGDYEIYYFNHGDEDTDGEDARKSFKHAKKAFSSVAKGVPFMQLQGNHDQVSTDTTEEAQQKYYAYIGANNVGTVTDYDNKFRNYGYRDFENYKIRVIYLNTADVSEADVTASCNVSTEQLNWLNTVALNLTDPEWGIIVLTHHPLNWEGMLSNLLTALDDYKGKGTGAKLIAHFHGHLHNFRVETLGTNKIPTITIPNACSGRENEYGTASSYSDDIKAKYGDVDAEGNQRQFNKTSGTANDTAFNVIVIDTENEKIYAFCYGAGINRTITFDGVLTETEKDEIPSGGDDNTGGYTESDNLVPTSTSDGTNIFDSPLGYRDGVYLSSSSSNTYSTDSACVSTGSIVLTNGVEAIYVKGATWDTSNSHVRLSFGADVGGISYNFYANGNGTNVLSEFFTFQELGDDYYKFTLTDYGKTYLYGKYYRISLVGTGENLIITHDVPIEGSAGGGTVTPSYTNLVTTSIDSSGNVYNGTGYQEGYRLNSSGTTTELAGAVNSGFIEYNGEVIRVYGTTESNKGATGHNVSLYDGTFAYTNAINANNAVSYGATWTELNGKYMLTVDPANITNATFKTTLQNAKYIRCSMASCTGANFVVTLDEEIT